MATALSGLAIMVAAHSFASEQVDVIAILRTLGASRRAIGWRYTFEILLLGALAALLGALGGVALEAGLAHALSGWVQGNLPAASAVLLVYGVVARDVQRGFAASLVALVLALVAALLSTAFWIVVLTGGTRTASV